ncbi:MAG: helix-turn-helix transcriptional regulator [Eggerthellaceae bacterium]|nr:helix-turn-helix transcriptional regulator [Eggerthellaceae bacterium]
MDHSQYIIDKLEEARDERGMPIAELARRSGIHRKRLWYILNGERKLRADEFVRLIVVMGTPVTAYVPQEMMEALTWSRGGSGR